MTLPIESGDANQKSQMLNVLENQINVVECHPVEDKISHTGNDDEKIPDETKIVEKNPVILDWKTVENFNENDSIHSNDDNLEEILLQKVDNHNDNDNEDENALVTQTLLEKFTENKSLILV